MYTIEDLEKAKDELAFWNNKFANDSSNNPNKYEAQRRDAGIELRKVEDYLKDNGLVKKTDIELLNEELDKLHPNAKSNSIHSMGGRKYKIRYFPLVQSRSRKTVKEWTHTWQEVS
jgi:hypothetical protein